MYKNVICTPQPSGSWPFLAPRALPGCPRASSSALQPSGSLEVLLGPKMAMIPRAKEYKYPNFADRHIDFTEQGGKSHI